MGREGRREEWRKEEEGVGEKAAKQASFPPLPLPHILLFHCNFIPHSTFTTFLCPGQITRRVHHRQVAAGSADVACIIERDVKEEHFVEGQKLYTLPRRFDTCRDSPVWRQAAGAARRMAAASSTRAAGGGSIVVAPQHILSGLLLLTSPFRRRGFFSAFLRSGLLAAAAAGHRCRPPDTARGSRPTFTSPQSKSFCQIIFSWEFLIHSHLVCC